MKALVRKETVLTVFAKAVPNSEKMLVDWSRDKLIVQFDNIHAKEFSVRAILDAYQKQAKAKGIEIVYE